MQQRSNTTPVRVTAGNTFKVKHVLSRNLLAAGLMMSIATGAGAQTVLLSENFNTLTSDAPPAGWSAPQDGNGHQWHFEDFSGSYIGPFNLFYSDTTITPGQFIGNGELYVTDSLMVGNYHFAYTESYLIAGGPGSQIWDMTLESPSFDATAYPGVLLSFDGVFRHYSPAGNSNVTGSIEVFDGSTWVPVYTRSNESDCYFAGSPPSAAYLDGTIDGYSEPIPLSKHMTIDLSGAASGHSNVKLRFRMTGNRVKIWALDNIVVTGLPVPVPLNVSDLDAAVHGGDIRLSWHAYSGRTGEGFRIQFSDDGKSFSDAGYVAASTGKQVYSFIDKRMLTGKGFYRLQILDGDGGESYSNVITVIPPAQGEVPCSVYPNPAKSSLQVNMGTSPEEPVTISITDMMGVVRKQQACTTRSAILDIADLSPGVYIVTIPGVGKTNSAVFVKE